MGSVVEAGNIIPFPSDQRGFNPTDSRGRSENEAPQLIRRPEVFEIPGKKRVFREGVERALSIATQIDTVGLNTVFIRKPEGFDRGEWFRDLQTAIGIVVADADIMLFVHQGPNLAATFVLQGNNTFRFQEMRSLKEGLNPGDVTDGLDFANVLLAHVMPRSSYIPSRKPLNPTA